LIPEITGTASVYDGWFIFLVEIQKNAGMVLSFTILTTETNDIVNNLHDRMPMILSKEEEKIWLSSDVPLRDIMKLCDPFPDVEMDLYRVSKDVNNVRNNHSDLIMPVNSK
jgi:putative SOS response-associated peptidase YedK